MRLLLAVLAVLPVFATAPSSSAQTADAPSRAIFAGGCFWCMQPPFDHTPGVISTLVGYAGGSEVNSTYKQVSAGETSHRESIEVTYDPTQISYEKLLEIFWHNINPIQADGQFHDVGDQSTTAIFYTTEEQKTAAEQSKQQLGSSGKFQKPIATAILPAGRFWPAEEYHQKYYIKNPQAYGMYRFGSGRNGYLKATWGETP